MSTATESYRMLYQRYEALEAEHQQLLGKLQKVSRQLRECARVADAFDKPEVATAYRWADAELQDAQAEQAEEAAKGDASPLPDAELPKR